MKIRIIPYSFWISVVLAGCSKPYQDALPVVQIVSVTPYGAADSVMVKGNVTSNGYSPVEYEGFCFSNTPAFDVRSRQVLSSASGTGIFSAVLPAYHDSTFYFKAFAANEHGYSTSAIYKYTVPAPLPDSAPCSVPVNNVIFNSSTWAATVLTGTGGSYGAFYVEADFGFGYIVDIYFNKVPSNGIYQVLSTSDFQFSGSQYVVTLVFANSYSYNAAGYVYVAQEKNGSTTVSFCGLVVYYASNNYPTSAKLNY